MSEKKDIQEENEALKKEFPLLFGMKKTNPFSTPDDYFEESAFKTGFLINAEIPGISEADEKDIPEGYFDELETKLKNRMELEALKKETFSTPENYFEETEQQLKTTVYLNTLKTQTFSTPENYFAESEAQINTQLYLQQFRNNEIFSVPFAYFENFESRLREKISVKQKPTAKIISLGSFVPKLKHVAAAAVLAGVCVMAWFLVRGKEPVVGNAPIELSALEKRQVIENPSAFGIDENTVIEMLDQNPQLLQTAADAAELTDEAMNEIVLDKDVDISTIVGTE